MVLSLRFFQLGSTCIQVKSCLIKMFWETFISLSNKILKGIIKGLRSSQIFWTRSSNSLPKTIYDLKDLFLTVLWRILYRINFKTLERLIKSLKDLQRWRFQFRILFYNNLDQYYHIYWSWTSIKTNSNLQTCITGTVNSSDIASIAYSWVA